MERNERILLPLEQEIKTICDLNLVCQSTKSFYKNNIEMLFSKSHLRIVAQGK